MDYDVGAGGMAILRVLPSDALKQGHGTPE